MGHDSSPAGDQHLGKLTGALNDSALFPEVSKLTDDQIHDVNDVRLALELKKTPQEIRAMPIKDRADILSVLEHDAFVAELKSKSL